MSALAGALLDQLVGALKNPASAGSSGESLDVIVGERWVETVEALKGILWVDGQVHGAWLASQPIARQIGKDLEEIAGNIDHTVKRLVTVIIPHSEAHLVGYVFSTGIVPLRVQVRALQSSVRFLMGWRGQIDTWKKDHVDPELAAWEQFYTWFRRNALPSIQTLNEWLKRPGTFAKWAVPILSDPIVVYLATTAKQATVDELTRLVVDHSPDVWRHVETAAVAILLQEQ